MDPQLPDGTCMAYPAHLTRASLNNVVARTMVRAGWFYRAWSFGSIRRPDDDQILVLSQDWCLASDIWQELVRMETKALPADWLASHPAGLLQSESNLEQRLFQMLAPDAATAAQRLERLIALKALSQ